MTAQSAAQSAPFRTPPPTDHACGTPYRLHKNLRALRIGSRVLFLDLAASRYLLLEGLAAEHFRAFSHGIADAASLRWLEEQHIIESGEPLPMPPLPPPATRSLFDAPLRRARPWLVAEALIEQIVARRRIRREPLASLLSSTSAGIIDPAACRPVVAACRTASRYRSAVDQCLPNALAMRAMLARRGIAATIVIGVTLPFAAHCWLQSDHMVLSDPFGSVQNFQPLVAA